MGIQHLAVVVLEEHGLVALGHPGRGPAGAPRGRARGRSPQPVPARRYYGQQAPTTDRYMEIQQALVTRGYLTTPPSGAWDPATVDALKRRFGKDVSLTRTVDPALIGGAIIDAGDVVIDGSLKGKLARLQTALAN